jgi:hypothetical protein
MSTPHLLCDLAYVFACGVAVRADIEALPPSLTPRSRNRTERSAGLRWLAGIRRGRRKLASPGRCDTYIGTQKVLPCVARCGPGYIGGIFC